MTMNKAAKAIILAAGNGNRLKPLTDETPKPLVKVNGIRMIDSIIEALHANGIEQIYIVVGYLKEQFKTLLSQYQGITLLENPYFNYYNNISSLYVARDYLSNAIIMDGDQIIYNHEILDPVFKQSCYCSLWTKETKEWLLEVEEGNIISCSRTGGNNGYQLFSVSFWSEEDGKQLKKDIEEEFIANKNTSVYWDDVALFLKPDHYELGIREILKEDSIEIDSLDELLAIDPSYYTLLELHKEK